MCFAVPYKVLAVEKNNALIEGNKTVRIGSELKVKTGEFLQVIGDIGVSKLSQKEGLKIRKLIKSLNN